MSSTVRWHSDEETEHDFRYSDSDRSDHSYSTTPTVYSTRPHPQRHDTCGGRLEDCYDVKPLSTYDDYRQSVQTYASTIPSEDEDFSNDDELEYEEPLSEDEEYEFDPVYDAVPTTPKDFSELFPSSRRLSIRHDDSTKDGNMNLRVDTLVEPRWGDKKLNCTLFHLRMQDLRTREFSLRRYCRDSGREVCHSVRKYQTPASERRPALQKSFSSAFATLARHTDSRAAGVGSLKRSDSGYGSINEQYDDRPTQSLGRGQTMSTRIPTNTIKLEFSNYAHVDLKRRGSGPTKRYQFEYWGHSYSWKRHVTREGIFEEVSYHLMREDKPDPLAHIVPVPMTTSQADEERNKGGWVPPCSMWITDHGILTGLPDVAE